MDHHLDRRAFLAAAGGLAAASLLPATARRAGAEASAAPPVSMAMHVHASFSEGTGSMEHQLTQAELTGVDVVWWTEHDHRMTGYGLRREIHFDGLTEAEDLGSWTWLQVREGALSSSFAGIVTSPASPADPRPGGSLRVQAVGSGGSAGLIGSSDSQLSYARATLAGQRMTLEVMPVQSGPTGLLELRLVTSTRPARNGRPAGAYVLSYRFGAGVTASRRAQGLTGIVTMPVAQGRWSTVRLDPAADLSAIWPDIDGRDACSYDLSLRAVTTGGPAEGYFDYLRWTRDTSLTNPLATQRALMTVYAARFPSVRQLQASEVTLLRDQVHMNHFGGRQELTDYAHYDRTGDPDTVLRGQSARIHGLGGLASYNHPYGADSSTTPLAIAQQQQLRRTLAARLVNSRCADADILEVGYPIRGRVELAAHIALWDVLSRNRIFLTGTGVTDSHGGLWGLIPINFVTWAWATGSDQPALIYSLRAGQVYFGDPVVFSGTIDLLVSGTYRMGSVSVSTAAQRTVTVLVTGVPAGGSVEVVQGLADAAGPGVPNPSNVVSRYPASAFAAGSVRVTLPNARPTYVRHAVKDSAGRIVAMGNPAWLLRAAPDPPAPPARTR